MKYDISSDVIKAISKLDAKTAGRIFKSIMGLPNKGDIKPLDGNLAGLFRLRVGDWRVIFSLENNTIMIGHILPRGDVYK